jgi:phage terminase small subunit
MRKLSKEEKELQGTYEPSKEGIEPVEYGVYERIPTAPTNWPPEAKKIWMDRCEDLKQSGYLVKAMMAPLRRYCFAVYQAEYAESQIMKMTEDGYGPQFTETRTTAEGNEYEVLSKWIMVLDNANKVIEKFGAKFGFTPLDIQKIPVIEKKSEAKTVSLLK